MPKCLILSPLNQKRLTLDQFNHSLSHTHEPVLSYPSQQQHDMLQASLSTLQPTVSLAPTHTANANNVYHQHVPAESTSHVFSQPQSRTSSDFLSELSQALATQINLSRLPVAEPPIFTGENPLRFPGIYPAIDTYLSNSKMLNRDQLLKEQSYTRGVLVPLEKIAEESTKQMERFSALLSIA